MTLDCNITADWIHLGNDLERMKAKDYQPSVDELENFVRNGQEIIRWIQFRINRVDFETYTESRMEENEENRTRISEIREWIDWANALVDKIKATAAAAAAAATKETEDTKTKDN
ncbi:hypothetical protein ONZ43_g7280 [Nemania bipapillata]|uniref:Uncharacterized protein n=1 Tax=Nemania bipapillata TaxID=110536 RepID=A0ACC2HRU7_9PEZI|nr:hypothetical protein ONZ43_g7280 [Nemania bipapillata]